MKKLRKYKCKKHGEHNLYWIVRCDNLKKYNGSYCISCLIDKLKLNKMEEIEQSNT